MYTIKDLENISGIKAHTIRIWEQRYSFLKPQRTPTNIRYYSNEQLKTLLNISLLNKYGFKISRIDKMSQEEICEKILSLSNAEAQQERIINDLIKSMADLDMTAFEDQIDNYILARGIEKAIINIIFPFLERIGILWLTDHINPAQEHLVSNIVRQKLIVGIEGISTPLRINKSVLLFLPENEYHEMGLLFVYYLMKSRGLQTIYLGANVLLKDVEYVTKMKKPDFLYTHITNSLRDSSIEKYIKKLESSFPSIPVYLSGQTCRGYSKKLPSHINIIKEVSQVNELIASFHR